MNTLTGSPRRFLGGCAIFLIGMLMSALMLAPAAIAAGPAAVNLGTAANFGVLAKTGVSTTGTTTIVGDVGLSPAAASYITGFGLIMDSTNTFSTSSLVTGKIYATDYTSPTPANMTTAVSDMEIAYTDAAGRTTPDFTELGAGNISGMTLVPGLYKWGTDLLIDNTGVTLSGSADDVWIFQIAGTLTLNSGSIITLNGGAQAKNIFWQVAGQTTLGTTSQFRGNILDQVAIVMNTGATLNGRALAQSAVTLDSNAVVKPVTIITLSPASLLSVGTVGVDYPSTTITASGGTSPYTYSVTSGTLPPGLSLASGVISGTPTATGTFTFVVTAIDANSCSGLMAYIMVVSATTLDIDIKANDSDGPITIAPSDTLSVTISLNAGGNTSPADWWVLALAPDGTWYYYNLSSQSFQPGVSVTLQDSLVNVDYYRVYYSALPIGAYTIYFGVDETVDGALTMNNIIYDSVVVNVQ